MRYRKSPGHLGNAVAAVSVGAAFVSGCTAPPAPPRLTYTYSVRTAGPVHTDVRVLSTLADGV